MPEHTPAPTPSRAIYGFVIYLLFQTLFVLFVLWAFIPTVVYEYFGITELPNKYFALYIPILLLTAVTLFAFCIYPSFSLIMTPNINDINTITDKNAIKRCRFRDVNNILCDNKITRRIQWIQPKFCDNHQKRQNYIQDYCDCTNKAKCLLENDKTYLDELRKLEHIPNAADLDISEVSEMLYG
ncbi:unnamed protein product [Diamesa serratosioi]